MEKFFSSSHTQLVKMRLCVWLGALAAFGLIVATPGYVDSIRIVFFTAAFVLSVAGVVDWLFRRQLGQGQALVTISANAIESPNFPGMQKRYLWSEIAGASLGSMHDTSYVQLRLSASANSDNLQSGAEPASPIISLAPFSSHDRSRLLAAISARVQRGGERQPPARKTVRSAMAEEREFREKLQSLAPYTWGVYLLVTINVAVWCTTLALGADMNQAPIKGLLIWGGNAASEVQRGEWWRLLTATFLHSGVLHLSMNMTGLLAAGRTVERIYGHRFFVLIYLGSALAGSAMSLHFSAQYALSVGASGAVFGVTGALLVAVVQHRKQLPKIFSKQTLSGVGFFIAYALIQGSGKQNVDNAAHIGGLLGGCLLGYFFPTRLELEARHRYWNRRTLAGIALGCTAVAGLAASAPPASVDQRRLVAGAAYFDQGIKDFDATMKSLQKEQQDVAEGDISERECDRRSKAVYAPAFRKIYGDFKQAWLPPDDPREPLLKDIRRLSQLLAESLAMQSVPDRSGTRLEPADPTRMAAINTEVAALNAHIKKWKVEFKANQQR